MTHYFNTAVAQLAGIMPAILFQHIAYWCERNAANQVNGHDGDYWTYDSVRTLGEQFPYMSRSQIRTALRKLLDAGLIRTGAFNRTPCDRTRWYALTEKGKSIGQNRQMQVTETANASDRNVTPIPDIDTDIDTDKDTDKDTDIPADDARSAGPKRAAFIRPTRQALADYARSIGYDLDVDYFIAYYDDRGWRRGNKPMRNWKLAVQTWKHMDEKKGESQRERHTEDPADLFAGLTAEQIELYDRLANDTEHWG